MESKSPGRRIHNIARKILHKNPGLEGYDSNDSEIKALLGQVVEKQRENPLWNHHKDRAGNDQISKNFRKSAPGSYRAVLKRKRKDFGCLFWDTQSENSLKQLKHEGKFQIFMAKYKSTPVLKYSKTCILCKTDLIWAKNSGKIWRQDLKVDREMGKYKEYQMKQLGAMISRNIDDFSVHQLCLDYAYGKK